MPQADFDRESLLAGALSLTERLRTHTDSFPWNSRSCQHLHGSLARAAVSARQCASTFDPQKLVPSSPRSSNPFAEYRAQRRAAGLDQPRKPRTWDTDGHVPRQWFRERIWKPACLEAGIDPPVRRHDLRHSHASWLLAGGADLQVVKERLGHRSIATTEKCLHTLPDADETALTALARVRDRHRRTAEDQPLRVAKID